MTRDELKTRTQQAIDAIRVFKDKDYGWSEMEKMLYEILIELDDSDWHTGTPTEDGYYLCHFKDGHKTFDACFRFRNGAWDIGGYSINPYTFEVIAWQKIEPFEEAENGNA